MNYLDKYIKLFPELSKERIVLLFLEGLGGYKGKAYHSDLHPKGRMGAKLLVYIDGELKYETDNASTLPDEICGKAYQNNGNEGSSTPTAYAGCVWEVYTKYHLNKQDDKHRALEIGLGSRNIEVIRDENPSRSSAINIHYRPMSDYVTKKYVTSAGCLTILDADNTDFLKAIGAIQSGKSYVQGVKIGKVLIDRNYISDGLKKLYKPLYKDMYNSFIGRGMEDVVKVKKTYEEIIAKTKEPEKWLKGGTAIIEMAKLSSNSGDIEIFQFFKEFVELIGND